MQDIHLTESFKLSEFLHSDIALKNGISNIPNSDHITNLYLLCRNILQPIRNVFGQVVITSGFRSLELNHRIPGAARHSKHMDGVAADCTFPEANIMDVFNWCRTNINFSEIIDCSSKGYLHIGGYSHNQRKILRLTSMNKYENAI